MYEKVRRETGGNKCPHVENKCPDCPLGCELTGHTCVLELGDSCKIWADIKKDWDKEDRFVPRS